MSKCEEEFMLDMSKITKQELPLMNIVAEATIPSSKPFRIALLLLQYLNDNHGFMRAVLGPKGDLSFQTRVKDFIWKTYFEDESNALIKETSLLVPASYLASYVASAHIGLIQQWLNSGRKETPEEMAQILSTITWNGPIFAAGLKK